MQHLQNLSFKQLITLFRHLQLGHGHLSTLLTSDQYKELLAVGELSTNQLQKMQSDSQEKIGNVSVVVNTILTSCFGAWLGFNAFSSCKISYSFGACILVAAFIFGLSIGYLSYFLTHSQALLALTQLRLFNFQKLILEILINKKQIKIEDCKYKISYVLQRTFAEKKTHKLSTREILNSIKNLNLSVTDPTFGFLLIRLKKRIDSAAHKLGKPILGYDLKLNNKLDKTDFFLNNALTNASYLKTLCKAQVVNKFQTPRVYNWMRKNIWGILIGLVPTCLGTFASMFVFLNGLPAFLNGLNIEIGFSPSCVSLLKDSAIVFAFLVSLYFGYSHLHSNYKSFKRAKNLEIYAENIAEKNNCLIGLTSQLNDWGRIFNNLLLIEDIYNKMIFSNLTKTSSPNTA